MIEEAAALAVRIDTYLEQLLLFRGEAKPLFLLGSFLHI